MFSCPADWLPSHYVDHRPQRVPQRQKSSLYATPHGIPSPKVSSSSSDSSDNRHRNSVTAGVRDHQTGHSQPMPSGRDWYSRAARRDSPLHADASAHRGYAEAKLWHNPAKHIHIAPSSLHNPPVWRVRDGNPLQLSFLLLNRRICHSAGRGRDAFQHLPDPDP